MKVLEFYVIDGKKYYGVVGETNPQPHQRLPVGLGYNCRCGWCWQGIPHTNESHVMLVEEWHKNDAADKAKQAAEAGQ